MKKSIGLVLLMIFGAVALMGCMQALNVSFATIDRPLTPVKVVYHKVNTAQNVAKSIVNLSLAGYAAKADQYLSRFPKSPVKGAYLAEAAVKTYNAEGIFLPVEFALAQMQLESACGTRGKSPKNNPYNVGEGDSGTHIIFGDTREGIDAWYSLVARKYLADKTLNELLRNYVNNNGKRYATSTDYEGKLKRQIAYIDNWFDRNS